ncbi:hypothetical protein ACQ33O_07490 [Ferruginibacter sp. SUN002]|uniref:hypothetical protein n=1 Tax=Ferruginibacter sp. SUN002 TaxID=2937789 RepID=UPI003D36B159
MNESINTDCVKKFLKKILLSWVICLLFISPVNANTIAKIQFDTIVTSTQQQAIAFINSVEKLDSSAFWPNIRPALFLKNLKSNVQNPIGIYPGNGTNFCAYGAITYLFLQDDPLGYATLLLQLYKEGKATFKKTTYKPSFAVRKAAGTMKFKGILDIHPAEQMWFLCLADHHKGYLNIFNRKFNQGDESTFWASVNYAKFNRMARKLLNYRINPRGSDVIHPSVGNRFEYISKKLETGKVVLFINNRVVHKKNHRRIKVGFPTHFIVLERITQEKGLITLTYWDYGGKTQIQLYPDFLRKIVFGITQFTKRESDVK